jgi:uncharacterized protein (DUF58 family)
MPTTRGWAAIGVAVALLGLWAGFGELELAATAVFLLIGVAVGMAMVRMAAPRVAVTRRLSPVQIHEGDDVVVELTLTAARTIRNLVVEDAVRGLGVARFAAARTGPRSPLLARYEVLCRSRGLYDVGPAEVAVTDSFGLTERRLRVGRADRLTVYPRVEALEGFPAVRGHDPTRQSTHPTFAPHGGEDFFTLREYQVGDDLRRVHWPSSAKRDELMIKQLEVPWLARGLVLLDQREAPYPTHDAFEHAVRGAASVVTHLFRSGFEPELWTGEREPARHVAQRYLRAMDTLATVQPLPHLDMRLMLSRMRRRGNGGGALLLITGVPDDELLALYGTLAGDFSRTVVMAVSAAPLEAVVRLQRAGAVTVVVGPDAPWSPAWRTAVETSWATASAG